MELDKNLWDYKIVCLSTTRQHTTFKYKQNIEKKIAISEEIKFKTVQKEIQVINNYDHKTISGL